MNRESIREYAQRQRERYMKASKKERGRILDEVVAVTGYHRKSVVRLLCGQKHGGGEKPTGRPVVYGSEVGVLARIVLRGCRLYWV